MGTDTARDGDRPHRTPPLIRRELIVIIALGALAAVVFIMTRSVAQWERRATERRAADEFRRGQQALSAGQPDVAVRSFRRAYIRDRRNTPYGLALARALAASGQPSEARHILRQGRDRTPENPDINLELARLAAGEYDVESAERYYHSAVYGVWPLDEVGRAYDVRVELIRFLLAQGLQERALAELLAANASASPGRVNVLEMARLFEAAGDSRRALGLYRDLLRTSPRDAAALAGAGATALARDDNDAAIRYLEQAVEAGDGSARTRTLLETASFVRAFDPFLPRQSATERRRRLTAGVARVRDRFAGCGVTATDPAGAALAAALDRQHTTLTTTQTPASADDLLDGLELVARAETWLDTTCGDPSPLDRALQVIARKRGVAP